VAVQEQSFASFFFVSIACHSAASPHIIVPALLIYHTDRSQG